MGVSDAALHKVDGCPVVVAVRVDVGVADWVVVVFDVEDEIGAAGGVGHEVETVVVGVV